MFRVLRPVLKKTGETNYTSEGLVYLYEATLECVGLAHDMEDAKRKYPLGYWAKCYSWVLEPIGDLH